MAKYGTKKLKKIVQEVLDYYFNEAKDSVDWDTLDLLMSDLNTAHSEAKTREGHQ